MSQLRKATLTELGGERTPTPVGTPIPVQFNPTSLRLTLSNNVDGGKTATRPAEQFTGTGSATLALELVFDTADEGTTDAPVSVRTKTATVSQFVRPKAGADKQAPPRVRFQWGDLVFEGVMTSFSEDVDFFAANGVPLRAKVTVSIQGQDPQYEALASGPGAASGQGATLPGGAAIGGGFSASASIGGGVALGIGGGVGIGVGGSIGLSLGADARIGIALGGESAASFAVRAGIDPGAWRSLDLGGQSTLSLPAGAQVAFPATPPSGGGLGMSVGAHAGSGTSLAATVGLPAPATPAAARFAPEAPAPVPGGPSGPRAAAAYALTAAGGVGAAVAQVLTQHSAAGASAERAAFAAPAGAPSAAAAGAGATGGRDLPAPSVDARALTFGRSVPLRPRAGATGGRSSLPARVGARHAGAAPALHADPTVAPWSQLPATPQARAAADAAQHRRTPSHPCGCGDCR